ncbi:hypothetical protein [Oscillibacter sp.]|uniref:hypothetical protein n=1 Tax=Oscillibacter sp. TaxID=1945593 RepID=UPI0028966190|nr:hypothetical protein [Oscillibacter sp.]
MENSIISEYCEIIFKKMKMDNLLGKDGEPRFQSEVDFCRYCEQIIRDNESETLSSEVMTLEKHDNHYQERFHIIGSIHKVFFDQTPNGKEYKYLHIEQMLVAFHYTPIRFMDWLLERYCYIQFSKALPDYVEYLRKTGLESCFGRLTQELYRRLYAK